MKYNSARPSYWNPDIEGEQQHVALTPEIQRMVDIAVERMRALTDRRQILYNAIKDRKLKASVALK